MASGPAAWASPGASFSNLAGNITSVVLNLPASLQPYLGTTADRLAGATEYLRSTTGLSPTALYTTAGVILLLGALPAVASRSGQGNNKSGIMRRYGFSNRWAVSPFGSQEGVPNVTDNDYSYITSADLEDRRQYSPRTYAAPSHISDPYSRPPPSPTAHSRRQPEDDVILIKYEGVTYPEHFPAYSIGDAKLLVSDVRDRVAMILDLTERQAKQVKLLYKGRRLKKADLPLCEYGVKDNSELLLILGEPAQGSTTGSEVSEGAVGVGHAEQGAYGPRGGSPRNSPKNSPRFGRSGRWGDRSPRESGSQTGLDVPSDGNRKRAQSKVRTQSPDSAVSAASSPPPAAPLVGKPGGPIEKLNALASEFNNTWLPRCMEFASRPPRDDKKRVDEHRRLSETILQKILLKLDAIDTSTEEGARALRKQLVVDVQDQLSKIDAIAKSPT